MRQGIHPLMRTMTVVMRNGASFRVGTIMNHPSPYFLQVVSNSLESLPLAWTLATLQRSIEQPSCVEPPNTRLIGATVCLPLT